MSYELIEQVVITNDKKRFAISEDRLNIRANQGHSIASVDLKMTSVLPPELLYVGINNASKKWTMPVHNWNLTLSQLAIYFDKRLDNVLDV